MITKSDYPQLNIDALRERLASNPIGHQLFHYHRVPSTMPLVREYVQSQRNHILIQEPSTQVEPKDSDNQHVEQEQSTLIHLLNRLSGTIFVAEEQTAGRGRQKRSWTTPYGSSLLLSILLGPCHIPIDNLAYLPMLLAVAATRSIERVEPVLTGQIFLKWPNDLLVGYYLSEPTINRSEHSPHTTCVHRQGKVAGILVETIFHGNQIGYAILGIGININQTPEQLPQTPNGAPDATSLYCSLKRQVDRTELLGALAEELGSLISDNSPTDIYGSWRNLLHTLGQQVKIVQQENIVFQGLAVDATNDGALIVENSDGERQIFHAGDVSIR
ncbi:biotin--[acetyl-CoA-carboxylase] ligase [Chloroflexi bacterium TSY]|nr:biotin--[acetyl-CoA-carboxylase] ligase [Chloroflexi bacterium TSY]